MTAGRTLAAITEDLNAALKSDTVNVIRIGKLLIEAHRRLHHGRWLPWLRENFTLSERTAQNYINAARFAAKYATVADLKLRPGALYALIEMPAATAAKVLKAAKKASGWIDREQIQEIAETLNRADAVKDRQHAAEESLKDRIEAEAILDGAPPELPPTSSPSPLPRDAARFETLTRAVAAILSLRTLAAEKLAESAISPADLESAATLLTQIAEVKRRRPAA
jgi:hypothetical protein